MSAHATSATLVTGAGGFIGRRLCASLIQSGSRVLAVDLRFTGSVIGEALLGDVADPAFVEELLRKYPVTEIVHLASLLNTASREDPARAARINVAASTSLIEQAARAGLRRFVYGSSISAYGTRRVEESGLVSEDSPACPSDVYGASKLFVELAGAAIASRHGLSFVSLRIPIVLGPGLASLSSRWRGEMFDSLGATTHREIAVPYRAGERLPVCHVEDAAHALRVLLEERRLSHLIYNAPAENLTCLELATKARLQNEHLVFSFGDRCADGIPAAIDSRRFSASFGFSVTPMARHLQRCRARQSEPGA